ALERVDAAANLGIDYTAGGRVRSGRGRAVLRLRFKMMKHRRRRLQAIKKAGADMRKSYNTGLDQAALGPIIYCSLLAWGISAKPGLLKYDHGDLKQKVHRVLDNPPKSWSACRGPMGAALLSLKRIGWKLLNPFEIETSQGLVLQLTATPPALLKYHLGDAWKAQLEFNAAAKMGPPQGRLDCSAAEAVLDDPNLTKPQKGLPPGLPYPMMSLDE
ncbi:unnamed protein product, partial [Prorocentrum cordatum]